MLRLVGHGLLQAGLACGAGLLVHRVLQQAAQGAPVAAIAALVGLVLCALALWGLRAAERADAQRLGQHYTGELRQTLWSHLLAVQPASLSRMTRGTLTLRLTGDLRALRLWVSLGMARTIVCAAVCAVCGIALAVVHPLLAASVLPAAGAVLAAGVWWGRRHTRPAVRGERRAQARLHAHVNERIHQLDTLVAAGAYQREHRRLERLDAQHTQAAVTLAWRLALVRHSGDSAAAAAAVALLASGAWLVAQGSLGLAQLTAMLAVLGLAAPTLREQGLALAHRQGAAVSRERVESFLRSGQAQPLAGAASMPARVDVDLNVPKPMQTASTALSLSVHDAPSRWVFGFGQLDLCAGACRVLTLAEPAQGRALLQAVQGLAVWPPGELRVDGTPVAQWPAAALRRHAVWLDSAAPLWRGSVDYNLRYLAPKADAAAVQAVLADVGLADWLASQRKGLRHRVVEGGDNLPLAVRQRLIAARALLAEPPLLLIDETVVPMDDATRLAVQRAMAPHRARGMAVLWAQMPATRAAANDANAAPHVEPAHAARPH